MSSYNHPIPDADGNISDWRIALKELNIDQDEFLYYLEKSIAYCQLGYIMFNDEKYKIAKEKYEKTRNRFIGTRNRKKG
jgi:hypothetical protein